LALAAFASSFLVVLLATPLCKAAARRFGLIDQPNDRSSHRGAVPRAGGLAIILGALAAVALVHDLGWDRKLAAFAGGALLVGAIGLWDDRASLPPGPRFAGQLLAALLLLSVTGPLARLPMPKPLDVPLGPLAWPLSILWIVSVLNFFNFLDGIDGLAAGQGLVTGLAISLAGWSPLAQAAGAALAGASAAFLIFNWSPASIFLGDAGSNFVGYSLAALPFLAAPEQRTEAVLLVALSLWFFLADATLTLGRRVARGERFYRAHRQHLYQRLADLCQSHGLVAAGLGLGALVLSGAALLAWRTGSTAAWWSALALAILLFGVEALLAARSAFPGAWRLWQGLAGRMRRLPAAPRYLLVLALDSLLVSLSFYAAFLIRFEGRPAPGVHEAYLECLPLLLAARLFVHVLFGVHRWSFRLSGFYEAVRLTLACFTGTAAFGALLYFLRAPGAPRSVIVIEFLLTLVLLASVRFSPRLVHVWFLDARRARSGTTRALIVGAGSSGDLLLRDLQRSRQHAYDVVGFVDDDASKWGTSIGGRPVLGPLSSIPEVARQRGVDELLFAIPRMPHTRLGEIVEACAELKLTYKVVPVSFSYLNERVSAAMLQDLAPEDLLARSQTHFDEEEMRGLLQGRRVLVTGAAGSIGSEICRQVARHGPQSLVLADINENDLYFLYRHLQQEHPGLQLFAEIVDIRDAPRLAQLGARHRVQDVFHAAAHKHVPLMEETPEEAIKNNVLGCLNVVEMAEAVGAERFVLISTDKAVNPASVMGASKRIAEMIVRSRAGRGRGSFTAVRFGNVLGSAGSVVPLFKRQIAAGGPVTVTHRDCRRYLMTIPEAVGLVILAGLGGFGDLCILEMGEPIRILDLARLMITLSGQVPERDVPIVFTGLRAGEKLDEELMTAEEEAQSRRRRDTIRVIDTPPAPADLAERIERLAERARAGDREGLLSEIRALLPAFESPGVPAPVAD
jgi:FlaA1/EpsC-like NDP-sugar epimerase/UDP-N-acetylmuramyl pentapeptide phosphotransferase/UDP-N-acetylglucosamine-1-phosphate transferase